jgi:hypothetical protein
VSDEDKQGKQNIFHYEGGVPVFDSRLQEVERKQAEAEARENTYRNQQLSTNNRMMRFTGVLVVFSALTGIINGMYTYITNTSAKAAKSAADTAKDTLHISERAYIVDTGTTIDVGSKSMSIPIVNNGHIPSGAVEIVAHEATINTAGPTTALDLRTAVEKHWARHNFTSIPLGWPLILGIPVPAASKEHLESGTQMIVVAGVITYNDRFSDTPSQQWVFVNARPIKP